LDDRFTRTSLHRFVVIVDRSGRIVAREDAPADPAFALYAGDELPDEVLKLASSATRKQTHLLSSGCLMHVVPIRGTANHLRALVFEELRVRLEP
jgi:hypothetical protein